MAASQRQIHHLLLPHGSACICVCTYVYMCVAASTFLLLCILLEKSVLNVAAHNNFKPRFESWKNNFSFFFFSVKNEDAPLLGQFCQGGRRWLVLVNESHKCQCPGTSAEVGQKEGTACCAT